MWLPELAIALPGDPTSWIALATAFYSVWQTAFKRADLKAFVPATIRYASPYQNSTFEVFEIPVTVLNQGARTGTVLAMALVIENVRTKQTKRFYAAGLDQWSLEQSRGAGFRPFSAIALAGRRSRSRTVLFYARGDSTVQQIVDAAGDYRFTLSLETALARDNGILARLLERKPAALDFAMTLPHLDHRAFTSGSGTVMLHHPEYQASR
jgi:Alpha-2-macroglobulin family